MVSPIDYTTDVLDPIQGYLSGIKFGEGLKTDRLAQEQTRQNMGFAQQTADIQQQTFDTNQQISQENRALAQQQRARAEAGRDALIGYVNGLEAGTATAADLRRGVIAFPQLAESFTALESSVSGERFARELTNNKQLAFSLANNNVDAARQLIETRLEAAKASGDERAAAGLQAQMMQLDQNPNGLLMQTLLPLVGTMSTEEFDDFHDNVLGLGSQETGPSQVRSSTILDDGTVVTVTDEGPEVYNSLGEVVTGQDAADAVRQAQEFGADVRRQREAGATTGRLETQVELGAEVAGQTEAGKTAIQIGRQTFERIGPLRANIGNLDRAIALVREEGANTGVIASKLPNWKDSTIELENLRSELGLDVVGSVTFGALSKGELDLALTIALPTNLSEPELIDWLERKRNAQGKLADYLTEQARFLSTPGRTLPQWIDYTESGEKDVQKWMGENPISGRTARAATQAVPEAPVTEAPGIETTADLPQSYLENQNVIETAKKYGVTPQELWQAMTAEQRAQYGN